MNEVSLRIADGGNAIRLQGHILVQFEKRNTLDMSRLWEEIEPAQPLQPIPLPLWLRRGRFQDVADVDSL